MEIHFLKKSKSFEKEKWFSLTQDKPVVSENDFVAFIIRHEDKLPEQAVLWLSEVSYELSYVALNSNNQYIYECLRNINIVDDLDKDFGLYRGEVEISSNLYTIDFAKIFLNQFGVCEVSIDLGISEYVPLKVGEIEIVSSKIRPNNLNHIFDYLLDKRITYWQPFSLAKSKNNNNSERQYLFWLIKYVTTHLTKLNDQLPLFKDDPRSRLNPHKEVVAWSESVDTNDSSLQWLVNNISVLERTKNASMGSVRIKNYLYNISEIQTEYLKEDTNVYENQIIHGYLIDIHEFFITKRKVIREKIDQLTLEISQIATLQDRQKLRYFKKLANDCSVIVEQAAIILNFFTQHLPVFEIRVELPSRIDGFEAKEHYRALSEPIQEWFSRDRKIIFGENELFAGTRSLDKLYELYCLFQIIGVLEQIGFKLIYSPMKKQVIYNEAEETEHSGTYFFESYKNINLKLHYERLPDTHQTAIWTKKNYSLKPDFIIEYKKKEDSLNRLIIFDAKYKSVRTIKRYTYSEMIPKYLHGIGRRNGQDSNIQALFLIHPEDSGYSQIESWHQFPFRLFDQHPIFPAIGRVEIPTTKGSTTPIGQIIIRLLQITVEESPKPIPLN